MPPSPSGARASLLGLGLLAGVFGLYHFTFAPLPVSDGFTYIGAVESGNYREILFSNAMLTTYSVFLLKQVLGQAGLVPSTLALLQTANAASATLTSFLLYRTILLLGGGQLWGALGAALLAVSYGFWYFANGEVHHFAMVFVLLVFYLLLRRRLAGKPYSWTFLTGVAGLNVTAGFLHQEHFVFGLTALALLAVGRPLRAAAHDVLVYTAAGILGSVAVLVAIGGLLLGLGSVEEIRRWYFWQLDYLAGEYVAEHPLLIVARLVKGQLTAWLFGTQVLADLVKRPALLGYARVPILAALTLGAYALSFLLLSHLWRRRAVIQTRLAAPLVAAGVWLVSYPLLLAWYFPAVTEYYLKTVPPMVLLVILGATLAERQVPARAMAGLLLAFVLAVNFAGAIWPWYRYGQATRVMEAEFDRMFRPTDLFVSFESGIDHVFRGRARFLPLKGRFDKHGREAGFRLAREAIETQLRDNGRVFAYNLVPAPFSLNTLNDHLRDPAVPRYRSEEFEAFVEELRRRYDLRPVLHYWEESQEPLYLYGVRGQPLWEVRLKTA